MNRILTNIFNHLVVSIMHTATLVLNVPGETQLCVLPTILFFLVLNCCVIIADVGLSKSKLAYLVFFCQPSFPLFPKLRPQLLLLYPH